MKKLLIILTCLAVLLGSCGGTPEAEIEAALAELIPASMELNEIYFGEGLPIASDRESAQAFYDSMGAGSEISLNYHPVSAECPYQSVEDIKAATLEVFSDSYADYLFTMAFKGLSSVFDEGTEMQVTKTVSFARYLENDGLLTVRMDIPEEAMTLNRTYDTADFTVIREKNGYILVEVQSYLDGQPDERIEVKLVKNADGEYRLDSPTY